MDSKEKQRRISELYIVCALKPETGGKSHISVSACVYLLYNRPDWVIE